MSIRIIALFLFVLGFSIYAWRNWFVSLCASVALMAVLQHPDMPKSLGGIQGLNPWNILMLNVLLAWAAKRQREGLVWDMPSYVIVLLGCYLTVILGSSLRLMTGDGDEYGFTIDYIISEQIVNCCKWVIPSFLLYDGCRTRQRIRLAMGVIILLYFLLAVQVIRWVPLSAAVGSGMNKLAYRFIQNEIGYNRVTLSMMLSGASWATLCCVLIAKDHRQRLLILGIGAAIILGQALTGGRSGYLSWLAVGIILSLFRWRKLLLVIPVVVTIVFVFMPGVRDRMLQGVGEDKGNIIVKNDEYEMTSGRSLAWPLVIDKIEENPILGYGRQAMTTTGTQAHLMETLQESFPHPHNAYLELLLDNGLVGFLLVMPFYIVMVRQAFRLLLDREDSLCTAVGGMACSLILALLVGAIGGQTFYPREGAVGMWAAIGLMLRVLVERQRSWETGEPLFPDGETEVLVEEPDAITV